MITLDGHLIGSIGEVLAEFHYGIMLEPSSKKGYDGTKNGKKIQIKITQRERILLKGSPEYLIVLYLSEDGTAYEVYNGPANIVIESEKNADSNNYRHIQISKLIQLAEMVPPEERIEQISPIAKMNVRPAYGTFRRY